MSCPELDDASLQFLCAYVQSSEGSATNVTVVRSVKLDVAASSLLNVREIGETPLHERTNIIIEINRVVCFAPFTHGINGVYVDSGSGKKTKFVSLDSFSTVGTERFCAKWKLSKGRTQNALVLVENKNNAARAFAFFPESYGSWLNRHMLSPQTASWAVYNKEILQLYRRVIETRERSSCSVVDPSRCFTYQNSGDGRKTNLNSLAHLVSMNERLIGTLTIKNLEIDGLDDLLQAVCLEQATKNCTVRLKFSIERNAADKARATSSLVDQMEISARWRNTLGETLHSSRWNPHKKTGGLNNSVRSTTDSIEWQPSVDANVVLRSTCFEIQVKEKEVADLVNATETKKQKRKTNKSFQGVHSEFLSSCSVRVDLKYKDRQNACKLLATGSIPLQSMLNNIWVNVRSGEENSDVNFESLGGPNDIDEEILWRVPRRQSSTATKDDIPNKQKKVNPVISNNFFQKNSFFKQKVPDKKESKKAVSGPRSSAEDKVDIQKSVQQEKFLKVLNRFASDVKESKMFVHCGINSETKVPALHFLDEGWLERNNYNFVLEQDEPKIVEHHDELFVSKSAETKVFTIRKSAEIKVQYNVCTKSTAAFGISFSGIFEKSKELDILLCKTKYFEGSHSKETFWASIENGQSFKLLPYEGTNPIFRAGITGAQNLVKIIQPSNDRVAIIDILEDKVCVYGEDSAYEATFRDSLSWKKALFGKTTQEMQVLPALLDQVNQMMLVDKSCEYCIETSSIPHKTATILCVFSFPKERKYDATVTEVFDDATCSVKFDDDGTIIKKLSIDAGSKTFPRKGSKKRLSKHILPCRIISTAKQYYIVKFEDDTVRKFPLRSWMVARVGMKMYLPKSKLILQNPNSQGRICTACFWKTHNISKSIWIDVKRSFSRDVRDLALVPLVLREYSEIASTNITTGKNSCAVDDYMQLNTSPWKFFKKFSDSQQIVWAAVLRKWSEHSASSFAESEYKANKIILRPNTDFMELTHLNIKLEQILRALASTGGLEEDGFALLRSSVYSFNKRLHQFCKVWKHKPFSAQGKLKTCLKVVSDAVDALFRGKCEVLNNMSDVRSSIDRPKIKEVSNFLSAFSKRFFGELVTRNIENNLIFVSRFAHTATKIGTKLFLVGGMGKSFCLRRNKVEADNFLDIWCDLASTVSADELHGEPVCAFDTQSGLPHNVHCSGSCPVAVLKRAGHTATKHKQNIIIIGGYKGRPNIINTRSNLSRGNRNKRFSGLRDLIVLNTKTLSLQRILSGQPKKGRYGHSSTMFSCKINGVTYDYILVWGGCYASGLFVGSEGRNDKELARILDCNEAPNYRWMKTSGAGTWVSATSQNTPTSISPPIHMEDTFEAPKAHAYHCAVSIKKPNFSRNAIIMFSGVRNIKSDKINRDLHLLSIKTNSSKRTPTVGMSWCKQVNVEGQAPAELCHMNATACIGSKIYTLTDRRMYILEEKHGDMAIWSWQTPVLVGPALKCIGATLTCIGVGNILCLGGTRTLDTFINKEESYAGSLEALFGNDNLQNKFVQPKLVITSDKEHVLTSAVQQESALTETKGAGNEVNRFEKEALNDSLQQFFRQEEDALWWAEHFHEKFSASLEQILLALSPSSNRSPLKIINPTKDDMILLGDCLNLSKDGVIDLFAMKLFCGNDGILRRFIQVKLLHQYRLPIVDDLHEHREYLMGYDNYFNANYVDLKALIEATESWLSICSTRSSQDRDYVNREENWILKDQNNKGSGRVTGGVLCAFAAFKLCVDVHIPLHYKKRHVQIDENIVKVAIRILRDLHVSEENTHTPKQLIDAAGDFICSVARNDTREQELRSHVTIDSLVLLGEKLAEFAVEAQQSFNVNESADRVRADICEFFKHVIGRDGYPTLNDIFNLRIVPTLFLLRQHSWGQNLFVTTLCEDILEALLGTVIRVEHFTQMNRLEYVTVSLLSSLKHLKIYVGHNVMHQYEECRANMTDAYPYAIVVDSGSEKPLRARLSGLYKHLVPDGIVGQETPKVIDVLSFAKACKERVKIKIDQIEETIDKLSNDSTSLENRDVETIQRANAELRAEELEYYRIKKYIFHLKEIFSSTESHLSEMQNLFFCHIQSIAFLIASTSPELNITVWSRKAKDLNSALHIKPIVVSHGCQNKPIAGYLHLLLEILRCGGECVPTVMVDVQATVLQMLTYALCSSNILQMAMGKIQTRMSQYMDEFFHGGALRALLDIVLKCSTISKLGFNVDLDSCDQQTYCYFNRKEKLIDRFAAVALVGCLRYLTLHFKIQPVEFGKIKSGLRNRTNSKGAEKCSTFNENIIEALYDIQVNFIDMESDVYLANEIRRLYQVIFSEDIDAESLLTPKSVDTFVLQIKKANPREILEVESVQKQWWQNVSRNDGGRIDPHSTSSSWKLEFAKLQSLASPKKTEKKERAQVTSGIKESEQPKKDDCTIV